MTEERTDLTPEELDKEDAAELPDREAMTVLGGSGYTLPPTLMPPEPLVGPSE